MTEKPRFKRTFAACLSCRTRKVKCDLGNVDEPGEPPCLRCKRERKECVFVESKRGGGGSGFKHKKSLEDTRYISSGSPLGIQLENTSMKAPIPIFNSPNHMTTPIQSQSQSPQPTVQQPRPIHTTGNDISFGRPINNSSSIQTNNNSTMVFLAHVAGNIAKPDDRDRIDAKQRIAQLEHSLPTRKSTPGSERKDSVDTEPMIDSFGHENPMFPPMDSSGRFSIPPPKSTLLIRPKPGTKLTDIEYICKSYPQNNNTNYQPLESQLGYLLTENESRRLIKLFFTTMHPFYPYIPQELHDPNVLPGYPMLLCTILAISTRYHLLPDKIGEWDHIYTDDENNRETSSTPQQPCITNQIPPFASGERHIAVHEQLWIYSQRLMSMTVWGESSSRSIGTLLSFLLFTEWNPRAIHFRWSDYANNADDDSLASSMKQDKTPINVTTNGYQNNDPEYAGLSAMKRSEIMSFMLIGTAARLSFLLDDHPLIFIATHISETHTSIGLHKKSMLQQTLSEVDINDSRFKFSSYQMATIELLQFLSLCYETLYGTKPKFIMLDKYQTLAILDILSPVLENWYKKYYKLLKPSHLHNVTLNSKSNESSNNPSSTASTSTNPMSSTSKSSPDWLELSNTYPKLNKDLNSSIERESLILDYYYTKLYLYSLALSGDTSVSANLRNSKKGRTLRLDELARYSRYVELAYKAAKEVLNVILRVKKLKLLKYIPVRWVTRVIKAVSFIVKCYLTLTNDFQKNESANSASPGTANPPLINSNDEILKMSVIPLEEIISLLQKVAICLRDSTPDELHLCTRYSTILMYLCSQFKSQMKEHKKSNVREYEKELNDESNGGDQQNAHNDESISNFHNNDNGVVENVGQLGVGITGTGDGGIMNVGAQVGVTGTSLDNPPAIPQNYNLNNANQELFDDLFKQNPSETLFNWFSTNDNNPGLDFVDQFTNEIERDLFSKKPN